MNSCCAGTRQTDTLPRLPVDAKLSCLHNQSAEASYKTLTFLTLHLSSDIQVHGLYAYQ